MNDKVWKEFKDLSNQTHQNLSGMLTDALREYINRRKIRPKFLQNMQDSLHEHQKLGKLLAK